MRKTKTLLVGGYIKTSLLDVDFIKGLNFNFTMGTVGGWSIGADSIVSGNLSAEYMEIHSGSTPYVYMKNADQASGSSDYSKLDPKSLFISSSGVLTPSAWNPVLAVAAFKFNDFTWNYSDPTRVAVFASSPPAGVALLTQGLSLLQGDVHITGNLYVNGTLIA